MTKDPFHPQETGAKTFRDLRDLCGPSQERPQNREGHTGNSISEKYQDRGFAFYAIPRESEEKCDFFETIYALPAAPSSFQKLAPEKITTARFGNPACG